MAQRQFGPQENRRPERQSQLDQARAQIAKTQAIIAQKLIRAPFAGRLGMRQVDLGQYRQPGRRDRHPDRPDAALRQFHAALDACAQQVKLGQKVEVTADAFPGRSFTAKITTIEPQIRADTRTMTVQATMPNPDEALLPGMFVNAAVVLPPEPDRVVLPETAVDYTLYGDSVYVVREDGADADGKPVLKAVRTPVKTGAALGRQGGDPVRASSRATRVVAAGQVKVQNGAASSSPASRRRTGQADAAIDEPPQRQELAAHPTHRRPRRGIGPGLARESLRH